MYEIKATKYWYLVDWSKYCCMKPVFFYILKNITRTSNICIHDDSFQCMVEMLLVSCKGLQNIYRSVSLLYSLLHIYILINMYAHSLWRLWQSYRHMFWSLSMNHLLQYVLMRNNLSITYTGRSLKFLPWSQVLIACRSWLIKKYHKVVIFLIE